MKLKISIFLLILSSLSFLIFEVILNNDSTTTRRVRKKKTNKTEAKVKFGMFYKNFSWGLEASGSGPGSTIEYTKSVREIIKKVINEYSIKSMLDAPCGSFHWMPLVLREIKHELEV